MEGAVFPESVTKLNGNSRKYIFFQLLGVLPGEGESATEITQYMRHVVNLTYFNNKILNGITLQLVVETYPRRDKLAVLDSGMYMYTLIRIQTLGHGGTFLHKII